MRYIWRGVEKLVNAVTAVCLHYAAVTRLRVFLYDISGFAEQHTGLDELNGMVEALARSFNHAHGIWVVPGLLANIVRFVQIPVKSTVIEAYVNI